MKKLIFFNKEGYPYNFQYDASNDYYTGKLMFDHNSNDTFKSLSIYTFEDVSPLNLSTKFEINSIELFSFSGITIMNGDSELNLIKNIKVVNKGPFYGKWIYGNNFDKKFPKGTCVFFSGISNANFTVPVVTDFQNEYYAVVDTQPNAVLILTQTINSLYNANYLTGQTYLMSKNTISYNDYNNFYQNNSIFGSLYLYSGQTLSLIDNNNLDNNGIYHLNEKHLSFFPYKNYEISTGYTGYQLRMEVELLTSRPKIYTGYLNVGITGGTANITFREGISILLNKNLFTLSVGEEFILEDYNNNSIFNNYSFTIQNIIDTKNIANTAVTFLSIYNRSLTEKNYFNSGSKIPVDFNSETTPPAVLSSQDIYYDYYIETPLDVVLNIGDIIILSGSSGLNNSRKLTINNFSVNTNNIQYKVNEYVIAETGVTYQITRSLKPYEINTIICSTSAAGSYSGDAIVYLTTNKFNLTQTILDDTLINTMTSFRNKYASSLNLYGIDTYNLGLVDSDYSISGLSYYPLIVEGLYLSDNSYQNYYKVNLFLESGSTSIQLTATTDTNYPMILLDVKEKFVTPLKIFRYSSTIAKNFNMEYEFNLTDDFKHYGFNLRLNGTDFYIDFSGNTETTLYNFKNKPISTYDNKNVHDYSELFYFKGFNLFVTGNTLRITTIYPNIDVWDLAVTVNEYSSFNSKNFIENQGTFLVSSDLVCDDPTIQLIDYGFSTGMIISISGSTVFNNKEYNIIALTDKRMTLSYQGHFEPVNLYSFNNSFSMAFNIKGNLGTLNITSREFIRYPRESENKDIYYKWSWKPYNEHDSINKNIFFFDFSGNQDTLQYGPKDEIGNRISDLIYTGPKPLFDVNDVKSIYLNSTPNMDTTAVNNPFVQQTIFDELTFLLPQYDDLNWIEYTPVPLQSFIGYNSPDEGVDRQIMVLEKIDNTKISGYTNSSKYPTNIEFNINKTGEIKMISPMDINFISYGFETGQNISLSFYDLSETGQTLFTNYETYPILYVSNDIIQLDLTNTSVTFNSFSTTGTSNSYLFSIDVKPKILLKCTVLGETEIEDERLTINLKNLGINISDEIEALFKTSDVKEEGIDYVLLNQKRKEMLLVYPEIYNYIGAYKSLINAINYFGYNTLQLYEYYRNIDPTSQLYNKLYKVLIPDIFDNSFAGWTEENNLVNSLERKNYKKTNLFNLTYDITDKDGGYVLLYSLADVQSKLQGVKKWLQQNIIPVSTNIVDITGVANTKNTILSKNNTGYNVVKKDVKRESTLINFVIQETQTFAQNFYVTIDFYTINPDFNPANGWSCKIKTFSNENGKLVVQQYFDLYKTDLNSFTYTYNKDLDPYVFIETTFFNENGVGSTNNIMRNMLIARNYHLINHNLHIYLKGLPYLNLQDNNYYFFDDDGFIFVDDAEYIKNYPNLNL